MPHTSVPRVGILICFVLLLSLLIRGIHRYQPGSSTGVEGIAAPQPLPRLARYSSFDRVRVQVVQLLAPLRRAVHIEIVKARLPEMRKSFLVA